MNSGKRCFGALGGLLLSLLTMASPVFGDACCLTDGSCADTPNEPTCLGAGGVYMGAGTTCATVECQVGNFDEEIPFGTSLPFARFDDFGGTRTLQRVVVSLAGTVGANATLENTSNPPIVGVGGMLQVTATLFGSSPGVPAVGFIFCDVDESVGAPPINPGATHDFGFVSGSCSQLTEINAPADVLQFVGAAPYNVDMSAAGNVTVTTTFDSLFIFDNFRGNGQVIIGYVFGVAQACCFDDGTCQMLEADDCTALGGSPQGPGSTCAAGLCLGACCLPDQTCLDGVSPDACQLLGGAFQGLGSTCATSTCTVIQRGCGNDKGSLVIFQKVEIRWDAAGNVLQDTFLHLVNDYPGNVRVQLYFINGDAPLAAAPGGERAHLGWNWADNLIELTGNQPVYWSALTGQPQGMSPFTVLDPGFPPGRPDPEVPGERMLRGYVIGWAVNAFNQEIRWNHLAGVTTIIRYDRAAAWEFTACGFQVVNATPHGAQSGTPGVLNLDGVEFAACADQLLFQFQAVNSVAYSGPRQVVSSTDLTLVPVSADLRQETDGPITTKAHFDVWNGNEVKFSGAYRCVTCWDQTLLANYGIPNHFLLLNLQTDHGKARIDGLASQLCNLDFDPSNNNDFPFPPGPGDNVDPRDIVSVDAAMLGVVAAYLNFDGGLAYAYAGEHLKWMGTQAAVIQYDAGSGGPPEVQDPGTDQPAFIAPNGSVGSTSRR